MDRQNLYQHSDLFRTTSRASAHSPVQSHTPDTQAPAGLSSSGILRKRLLEARERADRIEQPHTEAEPPRARDDWLFDLDDDPPSRRRPYSRRASHAQYSAEQARRPSQGLAVGLGSKDIQANLDKLSKDNFDLKLKVCLLEEKNTKLQAELDEAHAVNREISEERDELDEDNHKFRRANETLNKSQKECWDLNTELVRELEDREAALKVSLDMYRQLERKALALQSDSTPEHATPYSSCDKDSAYFGSGSRSLSTASPDGIPRPSTSGSATTTFGSSTATYVDSSPSQWPSTSRSATTATIFDDSPVQRTPSKAPRSRNPHIRVFSDSLKVRKSRTSELAERASVGPSEATEALQDALHLQGATTPTTTRTLSRTHGSRTLHGSQTSLTANPSSTGTRGLRTLYLAQRYNGSDQSVQTAQPEQNNTPPRITFAQRMAVVPDSMRSDADSLFEEASGRGSPVFSDSLSDLGGLTDGTNDVRPVSMTMSRLGVRDDDAGNEEPASPTTSTASKIPTEYQPGQYPRWPGTGKGWGPNVFFDGEGLDEFPRHKRW